MSKYKLTQKTDANGTTQDIVLDASCVDGVVKSVNNQTPDANGNVNVSGGDTSNYVDLTSAQTISGQKTFTSNINSNADIHIGDSAGNSKGIYFDKNGVNSAGIVFYAPDSAFVNRGYRHYFRKNDDTNGIIINCADKNIIPETDNNISLGTETKRWKDIYTNESLYEYGAEASRGVDAATNNPRGYYLVAYTEDIATYQSGSARIIVQDWDTGNNQFELNVKAYFGFDSTNNVKIYDSGIKVVNSYGTSPITYSANNFFIVMRTTNATATGGTNRAEIWYRQTENYGRCRFTFIYDNAKSRTDTITKWKKVNSTSGNDLTYFNAGTIAYLDNTTNYPTFIPTASWGKSAFISGSFIDGAKDNASDTTTAKTIYSNNLANRIWANEIFGGTIGAYNTVPNVNAYITGDVYTAAPSSTTSAQYLARDINGQYLGGMRVYHNTDGSIETQLMCRSQNTNIQNYVMFWANKDATANSTNKFYFMPNTSGNIHLGSTNHKWGNLVLSGTIGNGTYSYTLPDYTGTLGVIDKNTISATYIGKINSKALLTGIISASGNYMLIPSSYSSWGYVGIYNGNSAAIYSNAPLMIYYDGSSFYYSYTTTNVAQLSQTYIAKANAYGYACKIYKIV